jgi:mevalonate kinase
MNGELLTFKSSGKFLITAEYLILNGAKGLALPLKKGQHILVKNNHSSFINWTSKVFDKIWFDAILNASDLSILKSSDPDISASLQNIFKEVRKMNPTFLSDGVDVSIVADFNLAWGLGSSSTLINCIADWANIDPYVLLENTFGGSGYDVACASAKGPITYQLSKTGRLVEPVQFKPSFYENIFFVYLGKKMNSRTGMSYFKSKAIYGKNEIDEVSQITNQLIASSTRSEFERLLNRHENIMSDILQMPTVKDSQFIDYPYTIKSMGAWGGDFVLVTGDHLEQVKAYFQQKGLDTVIPYHEIVLS